MRFENAGIGNTVSGYEEEFKIGNQNWSRPDTVMMGRSSTILKVLYLTVMGIS